MTSEAVRKESLALGKRALEQWIGHQSRRPLPRGAVHHLAEGAAGSTSGVYGAATQARNKELLAAVRAGSESPEAAVSSSFVLARHGARIGGETAEDLWEAIVSNSSKAATASSSGNINASGQRNRILALGGRGLCDLLHVFETSPSFRRHADVATATVDALCADPRRFDEELQLWPQTLPLVANYLAKHAEKASIVATFLEELLVPFWGRRQSDVAACLAPHHAASVAAACARSGKALSQDSVQIVWDAFSSWAAVHTSRLGPRGIANLAHALGRVAQPGEDAPCRLLGNLLRRASALLDEPGARPFRSDWLGMLAAALARVRCRCDPAALQRLLSAHLTSENGACSKRVPLLRLGEVQNLALVANATLKLDVHTLPLVYGGAGAVASSVDSQHVSLLSSIVPACVSICADSGASLRRSAGTRSVALLTHAFGAALLLRQPADSGALMHACDAALQALFGVVANGPPLPSRALRVRFQILSSVQCWWCALGGPGAPLDHARRALEVVRRSLSLAPNARADEAAPPRGDEGDMPSATEAVGGNELISTKDHEEVVASLPSSYRYSGMKMEEFAFPFWLDIVLPPPGRIASRD
eukprot:TRINITY_DN41540_c0_g1_i1.p1 TRINITY_DN41540_c0_g1~~TRINITY_DN41540_c0_g1_i1.p1  ORF type:complete len:592 (+),score=87.33 TRINITY_DN41540_c0_g1_i1:79-1854(+)